MKGVNLRPLIVALHAAGIIFSSGLASAAGFQLWEQDGASVGNYHAGYAAEAADASTAFYNPAGITRIKNQEIVLAGTAVMTSFKYRGNVQVNVIDNNSLLGVTAQGGSFGFIPALHYVTPIGERVGFGFSIDVPFGLKVDYGHQTDLRYVSTVSSVSVVDISPTLAIKATDKASFGIGPDFQRMDGTFNMVGTIGGPPGDNSWDSDGINNADDTGYGYHLGGLYEFTPCTRVGVSYHSQVVHHLTGTSKLTGPIARSDDFPGPNSSSRAKVNITLPPYTALSGYHLINPQFAVMASVIYTQWDTIKNLVLQNVASVEELVKTNNTVVTIPQYFRNTWNFTVGGDYYVNDQITLRTGVGFDETPVSETYRNVQMPDNNRYVIAFGGHYQATKCVGLDLGWMHIFINKAHISPPPQRAGDQVSITNGSVSGGADAFSGQVTWDIV